jgi:hypothetical protein
MNVRRRLMPLAVLCGWLATLPSAGAHRVDEYLQAARLGIDVDRVDLEIDLTAGTDVASGIFASIDTNDDGEISSAEGELYARQVFRSVALTVDGSPVSIKSAENRFPEFRDMSLGVGTIQLRASAKVPAAGAGRHQLSFLNTHRSESSVYLVNALIPANPRIQIADQRRDSAQHGITLDYMVIADAPSARTFALIAGLVLAGRWFLRGAAH